MAGRCGHLSGFRFLLHGQASGLLATLEHKGRGARGNEQANEKGRADNPQHNN